VPSELVTQPVVSEETVSIPDVQDAESEAKAAVEPELIAERAEAANTEAPVTVTSGMYLLYVTFTYV
jgi:hypothetical protein